jgi:phenylalanyl-tRNA synthetase beta chain
MDIKLTDSALRHFLETSLSPVDLAQKISLCGPTFDRLHQIGNDFVYDIEVITNRVDTASAQGIAREAVAILKQMSLSAGMKNDPYLETIDLYPNLGKTFSFEIDQNLVSHFVAVSLDHIQVKESPQATKTLLELCDERPINNIVDITNELTLLYGMPCHIFDLDKLGAQKLTIRESRAGEMVKTLDDQNNKLKGGDIVIEDGAGRLVDLCGIMGGQIAEVDEHTKNILLIVPVYQAAKIRRSSLYLQKRTLASQIYEKQPDPNLCLPVLTQAIELFQNRAGAQVSSAVFDFNPYPLAPKTIDLDTAWLNRFIGVSIPQNTVMAILHDLGFQTTVKSTSHLDCLVPSWRYQDINLKEDLAEEVARVYGYYRLPPVLPCVNLSPESRNILLSTETKIKTFLSDQGFNEIYNSSLISEDLVKRSKLSPDSHLKLKNALSEDYQYLRISLVPSILQNIKDNQGKTDEPYYLFELSNIYLKTKEKLPDEYARLVIATTIDYRHAKGLVESLLLHLNIPDINFKASHNQPVYFHDSQTAHIYSGSQNLGYFGFVKPSVLHDYDITTDPIIAEIDMPSLAANISSQYTYRPISEFPEVSESLTISSDLPLGDIIEKISVANPLVHRVIYTQSYKNKHTFKIYFVSHEKNLTQNEVNLVKEKINHLFD